MGKHRPQPRVQTELRMVDPSPDPLWAEYHQLKGMQAPTEAFLALWDAADADERQPKPGLLARIRSIFS